MSTPTPQVSPAKVAEPLAQLIALDQIHSDPNQPRKAFDDVALKELSETIKTDGVVSPILVRPNGKGFYIVAGERRVRAARMAGLKEISSIVRADLKDADVATLQLVENVQRENLSLPEQCEAVAKLVKTLNGPDGKGGQARAALKLGKSEAWVSKRAGLVEAPKQVADLVNKGHVIDAEVAAGLVELLQVVPDPKKDYEVNDLFERAKNPDSYGGAPSRSEIRDAIRDAKAAIKHREEAAKEAAKTRKANASGTAKPDPYREQQAKERAQKDERARKWKLLIPVMKKFGETAGSVIGASVELPQYNEWYPDAPPASVGAAEFGLRMRGTAEQLQKLAGKTGLKLELETVNHFPGVTAEQARKIEQVLGKTFVWVDTPRLTGEQVAKVAAKCGKAIEIPVVDLAKPMVKAAAPATKQAAKKGRGKK